MNGIETMAHVKFQSKVAKCLNYIFSPVLGDAQGVLTFNILSCGKENVIVRECNSTPKYSRCWEGSKINFVKLIKKPNASKVVVITLTCSAKSTLSSLIIKKSS